MACNCKNCGAPLKGKFCEFCGTKNDQYKDPNAVPTIIFRPDLEIPGQKKLYCKVVIPHIMASRLAGRNGAVLEERLKIEMSRKLADEIMEYMDIQYCDDFETLDRICLGSVTIVTRK